MRLALAIAAASLAWPAPAQEVVAARTLRPGDLVAAADLALGPEGEPADIDALAGLEIKRAVYRGRAVTAGDLGPPTLVRRNERVTLSFAEAGLQIRTEGRAMEDGAEGDPIRVMNMDSRQTVIGTVRGPGHVEVGR